MVTVLNFRFHSQSVPQGKRFTTLFSFDNMDGSKKLKSSRKHIREKPFKCDVCNKTFSFSSAVVRHKRTHTGQKPFKCHVCDKRFSQRSSLFGHKRTHTGEKPFKCDVCEKGFTVSGNLVTHKRTHTGEKPFKCDACDKAFTVSGNLVRHKRTHTREKPFKCDVCDKEFTQLHSLKLHSKTDDRENDQVAMHFECKECNMKFSSPRIFDQYLLNHELEAIEPTGMEYICVHCDETFDFAKKIQDHVNEVHVMNKNHSVPF